MAQHVALVGPEQFEEIREIVRIHHESVVDALFGSGQIPESVHRQLEELGIPRWGGPSMTEEATQYGVLTSSLPDPFAAEAMTYREFVERVAMRPEPLTREEAHGVEFVARKGAVYCRGLGNRVDQQTGEIMIEVDSAERWRMERGIREAVALGKHRRESIGEIKTRIGRATGDWGRDLHRIATTEANNAVQMGRGAAIADEHGEDARVAKIPNPGACDKCKELYLDANGIPRIFALSEIRDETNARDPANPARARRKADMVPTLESAHPNCQCQLTYVPANWTFERIAADDWEMVPDDSDLDDEGDL